MGRIFKKLAGLDQKAKKQEEYEEDFIEEDELEEEKLILDNLDK
jgi:hypothetical protein